MYGSENAPLSPKLVTSLQKSQNILRSIRYDVLHTVEADARFDIDRGANNLLDLVDDLLRRGPVPSHEEAASVAIPEPVRAVFAEYLVPGYAALATQLQGLWTAIIAAVNEGDGGEELIDQWLQQAEMPGQGALAQVEQGREELLDALMPVVIVIIDDARDIAEDALAQQRESAAVQADLDRELKKIFDENDKQDGHDSTET